MFIRKNLIFIFHSTKFAKTTFLKILEKFQLKMKALRASLIYMLKFKFFQSFADDFVEFLLQSISRIVRCRRFRFQFFFSSSDFSCSEMFLTSSCVKLVSRDWRVGFGLLAVALFWAGESSFWGGGVVVT
jgi:hypothetical protein